MLIATLRFLVIALISLAGAFAVAAWILPGMEVSGGFWSYIWVGVLFGVVNAIIGTILRIITLPLKVLTLGLFSLIVNAALLKITARLSSHLTIDKFFWTAIWAAIIISLASVVLHLTVGRLMRPPS